MPNAPSMVKVVTSRNLGLDLVRATEAAALAAGRYVGLDHPDEADHIAGDAMYQILNSLDMDGYIVTGEELKLGMHSPFDTGARIGAGKGPMLDVVVDPIEGRSLLASGRSGAIAACAVAPVGSMWAPQQAIYMEKIIVDAEVAPALVPECMDAPAAWTLALVARLKKKDIHDLVVFVLDRPRHAELVDEIRRAGARVMLRAAGDVAGALLVVAPNGRADMLMGVGGVSEGIMAACAVRALGGGMLGRLAPQSDVEREEIKIAGLSTRQILSAREIIASDNIFFAATGITDGPLLSGVRYHGKRAETHSLILRGETGTRRLIYAEHVLH